MLIYLNAIKQNKQDVEEQRQVLQGFQAEFQYSHGDLGVPY